jgi:uncharacterized protein (DUF885 family)
MRLNFAGLVSFLLVAALLSAPFQIASAQTTGGTMNEATRTLHALFDSEWEYAMEQNPTWASMLGDRRYNDRWENVSLEAIRARHEHQRQALERLNRIDRNALSPQDQLNYDLFKREYETDIAEYRFRWYLLPVNQRGGIQTIDELTDLLRFQTVKDYEDWVARLRALPALIGQTTALMREGMTARMMLPRVILNRIPGQIDNQIVQNPQQSPLYKPFRNFHSSIPQADRERLERAAQEAISSGVIPAYRQFKEFFTAQYLPASFEQVGVWQNPQGEEMYTHFARRYTTTNLTPREIHELGLREVARIRGEMERIMRQVGFQGSLQDFFRHLRTDPQFYYRTPEELLTAYRAMSRRIDPLLVRVFRRLPRMPYAIEPIPANIAPDTTTAYYNSPSADGSRAGIYYVNLYRPETRPRYEMMALSLHEAMPGHHLQIALAQELGELPRFRRYGGYTAFVEGWGLYAESLGDELGLYDDPYSKFGQLTYEMWRAVRLVVDTGIHSMRWDRQRAINFFLENAAKTELDVTNEIDRYISWPGQALAYKIGELKIKELRARAARELGDRFDVRDFHDVVLSSGAVPLDVLERNVDAWIARTRTASANQTAPRTND